MVNIDVQECSISKGYPTNLNAEPILGLSSSMKNYMKLLKVYVVILSPWTPIAISFPIEFYSNVIHLDASESFIDLFLCNNNVQFVCEHEALKIKHPSGLNSPYNE